MNKDEQILDKFHREGIVVSSLQARIFSMLIDDIVISVLFFLIYLNKISTLSTPQDIAIFINSNFAFIVVLKIIYQTFFIWMYGATLGKIFMKIKVITIDYIDKPNLLTSFVRAVVRIISEMFFYLGFLWAFFYPLRQTWHDKVAKTAVINV